MKRPLFAAALSLLIVVGTLPELAQAKRLGGGKSVGMQRQAPPQAAPQTPAQAPAAQAAPVAGKPAVPATAAAAAAAPAKRSWLGPIAGLAAGLGLAALFSAMGFGEGFASFVTMLLLAIVAFFVIRLIISRLRGGAQPALAGAGAGAASGTSSGAAWNSPGAEPVAARSALPETTGAAAGATAARAGFTPPSAGPVETQEVSVTGAPLRPIRIGEALSSPAAAVDGSAALSLPDGFDLPAFERVAKMIFIRLQAANDAGDLDDLREFTTPEVFAALRLDIQERSGTAQHTDVERVDAQLIDFVQEPARQIASVRFTGQLREERDGPSSSVDEIWHLVKPQDGSRNWAIAGIQQAQ